ncbi:MAG: hypothetical protein AMXMBFR33_28810 [Candidatus Xenobia bacterium]
MNLVFHPEAAREAREAREYLRQQDPELAVKFDQEIGELSNRIAKLPESFPLFHAEVRKAVMRRFRYTVFFEHDDSQVRVLAVSHQRREPNYWLERL